MNAINFDKWTSLFLIAGIQGLFLGFLLIFSARGNKKANRILGTLILAFSLMIGYYVAFWSGLLHAHAGIYGWTDPLYLIFGPLLFFYLSQWKDQQLPKRFEFHLLPFFIHVLIYLPFLFSGDIAKRQIINEAYHSHNLYFYLRITLEITWNLSILIYSIVLIRMQQKTNLTISSSGKLWMKLMVYFFVGYSFSTISYFILLHAGLINVERDYAISGMMAAFIYLVGYLGFRQPELIHGFQNQKTAPRYTRSTLTKEKSMEIKEALIQLMQNEKPFLESELKIQDLASRMGLSIHHLSQVINDHLQQSFPEFINQYRIREACRLLTDPRYNQEKILGIAFDTGFGNKATFNATFRKITGMSPSAYRQNSVSDEKHLHETLRSTKIESDLIG
ncbi:hypothetical protein BH11BAC2_BH11BAC2_23130 [soil metagenome]